MVQKVQVQLVDDLSGGPADETVLFGLDGKALEIDLSAANAKRLRAVLAEFTGAARHVGGRQRRVSVAPARVSASQVSAPKTAVEPKRKAAAKRPAKQQAKADASTRGKPSSPAFSGTVTTKSSGKRAAVKSPPSAEEVRAWARKNGVTVNNRGRVPGVVFEAFEASGGR